MSKLSFSVGILCGGQATRMGGVDKGLQKVTIGDEQPIAMVERIMSCLTPFSKEVLISANRNLDVYRQYSPFVFADIKSGSLGPMAGLHTLLHHCPSDYLLTTPCDTPFLTAVYAERMLNAFDNQQAGAILVATAKDKFEPLHLLIPKQYLQALEDQLSQGKLSVNKWLREQNCIEVDFSDLMKQFININTFEELNHKA